MAGAVRYHINPETQRPNICGANIKCAFAVEGVEPEHFSNKQEARAFVEKGLAEKSKASKNPFGSLSKKNFEMLTPKRIVKRFSDFDPFIAEPDDFDEKLSEVYDENTFAYSALNGNEVQMQRMFSKPVYSYGVRSYPPVSEAIENAERLAANGDSTAIEALRKRQELIDDLNETNDTINDFAKIYASRGTWNRAYLVSDGHLHKSRNCSTCNKNGSRTKFHFMTEYSGKNESEIVEAAGYRACTTCYPSAPVGDANNLPSVMLTPEEAEAAKNKVEVAEKRAKKASDAIAKAPNKDGSPLTFAYGRYKERFTTERAALIFYSNSLMNKPDSSDEIINETYATSELRSRYHVIYAYSAKNNLTIRDAQKELAKKTESKLKRINKQYGGDSTFTPDDYKLPDNLLDTPPSEWSDEDQEKYYPTNHQLIFER